MTIRDVELATGMTRANIRFYEEQGLISPERQPNGYREYTQTHVDILLRVKLLRALGMSVEKIRKLVAGESELLPALDEQIRILSQQQRALENSQRVCRQMRDDQVRFETLDAKYYLHAMDHPPDPKPVLEKDVQPKIYGPWRRFFARELDTILYAMLLGLMDFYWFPGDMPNWLDTVGILALTLFLEPLQLHFFGTTFGKWIFGITVTDLDGHRMFYSEAFRRTMGVLVFGLGLNVPVVSLWRQWRSYRSYADGMELVWEEDSELTIRDDSNLRFLAAIGAAALLFGGTILAAIPSYWPPNRGDLTAAEFVENYNWYAAKYDLVDSEFELHSDGTWWEAPFNGTAVIHLGGNSEPLDFVFTTDEAGLLTGVSFREEITGDRESWLGTHQSQQILTAMAFTAAREEFHFLRGDDGTILDAIQRNGAEGYSIRVAGVAIACTIDHRGYFSSSAGGLIPDETSQEEPWFSLRFTMTIEE